MPLSARVQNNQDDLRRVFLFGSRLASALTFPSFLGLALTAPELIEVILGDEWARAAPFLRVLALIGLLGWPVTFFIAQVVDLFWPALLVTAYHGLAARHAGVLGVDS